MSSLAKINDARYFFRSVNRILRKCHNLGRCQAKSMTSVLFTSPMQRHSLCRSMSNYRKLKKIETPAKCSNESMTPLVLSQIKEKPLIDEDCANEDDVIDAIKQDIAHLEKLREQFIAERIQEKKRLQQLEVALQEECTIETSDVTCGGCGMNLHCSNSNVPGFVPKDLFVKTTKDKLPELLCQRCMSLKIYDKIIHHEVDAQVYKNLVMEITRKKGLVVMIVDVTDIGNTVIHDFIRKIGSNTPLFVVGNKVDLIPEDQRGYMRHILQRIMDECSKGPVGTRNNVIDSCLISAKTGYGMEDLIWKLLGLYYKMPGNVYLVGMTNCGKSTIFNAFLRSDYCKHTCRDLVQRATVSHWPGTTLNLIKFPILKPRPEYMTKRNDRLFADKYLESQKRKARQEKLKELGKTKNAIKFGLLAKTEFRSEESLQKEEEKFVTTGDHFVSYTPDSLLHGDDVAGLKAQSMLTNRKTVTPEDYPDSKWTYDTPGLINTNQYVDKLTAIELKKLLKVAMIRPQVFVMRPGMSMLVTGLGRIDYLHGVSNTVFTVHINQSLPIHVLKTFDAADEFYAEYVGTEELGIPLGDQQRLDGMPSLCGREFYIDTEDNNVASADIQLSSLGWVSVAAKMAEVHVRAYTPGGMGMYLRSPALLPNILAFKGTRISRSHAYRMRKPLG